MSEERPEETAAEAEPTNEAPETEAVEETAETEQAPAETVASAEDASSEEAVAEGEAVDESGGLTLGSGEPSDEEEEEARVPHLIRGRVDQHGVAIGTGRRKTSVARVRIKDGNGQMTINGRTLEDYFHTDRDKKLIQAPLEATESLGSVDVWVRVNGGGTTGQAGAILLGIARALQAKDPTLHGKLSDGGFLTRDGRMVERKKYGFKKARKSFQFSKR